MTLNPHNRTAAKRRRSAFTLAEVLAALLLMVIVIPVAMQGMRVAGRAGEVAQRKMVAARVGNKVLNELKVTGQLQSTSQTGVVQDRGISYKWSIKSQGWTEDTQSQMTVAALTVSFLVQGKNYEVHLGTLMPPPQSTGSSTSTPIY